jgi:hypothetical protein
VCSRHWHTEMKRGGLGVPEPILLTVGMQKKSKCTSLAPETLPWVTRHDPRTIKEPTPGPVTSVAPHLPQRRLDPPFGAILRPESVDYRGVSANSWASGVWNMRPGLAYLILDV